MKLMLGMLLACVTIFISFMTLIFVVGAFEIDASMGWF